ncbi:DNA methyltransferase [Ralstonia pickettii]|uniref:DNA-methyltransferase n=1 Tax=Ralstonia pickettii TaxID=329 RepID=UPI0027145809|nr:DNA methyltransferase [Ralstonia pickettii]WKZ84190.1 DNA methyltransferase [Ralstonia pickettii]
MKPVQIGNATLYCGDSYELLPTVPRSHACITDPPYGINIAKMTGTSRNRWNTTRRTVQYEMKVIGDDQPFDPAPFLDFDRVVLFGANHFGSRLPDASCWFVWDKRDGSTSDHQADCELAWTNLRGPARLFSHKWRGMIRAGEENLSRGGIRVHPTQKPVALMLWALSLCKLDRGTVVFDPFMGSGTTGIAALRSGHPFIGVELDPEHFSRACERIEHEQRQGRLIA